MSYPERLVYYCSVCGVVPKRKTLLPYHSTRITRYGGPFYFCERCGRGMSLFNNYATNYPQAPYNKVTSPEG